MMAAAMITPNGSDDPVNTGLKPGSTDATPMATRKATNIAVPPIVGNGAVWTRRSSG